MIMPPGDLVPQAEDDSEGHVDNAEDERYLHLVGVEETDLVSGRLPHRVNTERIGIANVLLRLLWINHSDVTQLEGFVVASREGEVSGPVAAEYIEGFGKYVVVD